MKFRFLILIGGTVAAFLSLGSRMYVLQIARGEDYAAKVRAQNYANQAIVPDRGIIYLTDKNGSKIPAAMNKEYSVIFAVPKEIQKDEKQDVTEVSQMVAAALNLDSEILAKSFAKPNDLYEKLISRASPDQIEKIKALKIKGLYIASENARYYPLGRLAAQVLGFVGLTKESDMPTGQYGIESFFNNRLSGRAGVFENGRLVTPVAGENIFLTIDQGVQSRAEEILESLVKEKKAVSGTVIVEEPSTGKIVALGNYPTFDPNQYASSSISTFTNPAVQSLYEPGSIFKIITMSAGIDSGKITPQTTYYDSGFITLDTKTIKNWDLKAHGTLTMTNVIEQSVNTGAVFAQRQTGKSIFYDYLVKFGFKVPTGITLPGEIAGRLSPLEKNIRDINYATASFGQGVSVTPIRLIAAISAIANGGVLKNPYIIEGQSNNESVQVISAESAKQVTGMMVSAVKKAVVANIPNYNVAGKTGTAQIPDFKNGGYLSFDEGLINTYVGFAPAYKPKFTILIKLEKPQGAPLAGTTVVPAFRELAEFLLNYYDVAPDNLAKAVAE